MTRVLLTEEEKNFRKIISRKLYYENNKIEINIKRLIYNQTPAGIKSRFLSNWKFRGITFGNMTPSFYYDVIFLPTLNCMSCEKKFDKIICNNKKCNDHNGKLDKEHPLYMCNVRGTICFECNVGDNWKKRLTPNSIYNQYL